jgi:hypothetical protein
VFQLGVLSPDLSMRRDYSSPARNRVDFWKRSFIYVTLLEIVSPFGHEGGRRLVG